MDEQLNPCYRRLKEIKLILTVCPILPTKPLPRKDKILLRMPPETKKGFLWKRCWIKCLLESNILWNWINLAGQISQKLALTNLRFDTQAALCFQMWDSCGSDKSSQCPQLQVRNSKLSTKLLCNSVAQKKKRVNYLVGHPTIPVLLSKSLNYKNFQLGHPTLESWWIGSLACVIWLIMKCVIWRKLWCA